MLSENSSVTSALHRLLRIALAGLVCVLAVVAAGRISERLVLGADQASARARLERDVRGAFDVMARGLKSIAGQVADADALAAATKEDEAAARRLFDAAQAASVAHSSDVELAVTAYALGGMPIAWAGRPSELPQDRVDGDE